MDTFVCLDDFYKAAAATLPKPVFDYYRSGANEEVTLADNEAAFKRIRLRPRMLRDVAQREQRTSLLGAAVQSPIGIAPTAMHAMAHHRGEAATAEAAAAAGVCYIQSTLSTVSLEEVAQAHAEAAAADGGGLRWFQLYVYRDRELTRRLIRRVEAAGFRALVITVDTPLFGQRWDDMRNGFALPHGLHLANFDALRSESWSSGGGGGEAESGLAKYSTALFDPSLGWADIRELCAYTTLPVVVKGVLCGADAQLAAEAGARAVIVSNHGARQLDGVLATIDALVEVVAAAAPRALEVYLDGGVRTGTDVLKALALGARAVFIGRPVVWGLACGGRDGVDRVLSILAKELDVAMALSGVPSVGDIVPALIVGNETINACL